MAGPVAEEIAAVAATHDYISKDSKAAKVRKKAIARPSRNFSETVIDEPSSKEVLAKYEDVKHVRKGEWGRGGRRSVGLWNEWRY